MPDQTPTSVLAARGLRVVLSGDLGDVTVLDDLSLSVDNGEIVDIGGPSGSGKTTLLRALARLLPSHSGRLWLRGEPDEELEPQVWRRRVALLPQKPAIVSGSIRDNLLLPWRLKVHGEVDPPDDNELRRLLGEVAMGDVSLDRDASRLSVGQQARLALVRVLLTQPSVLLLDEPDAALDEASANAVRSVFGRFAENGGAIIRVRHREDDGVASRRLLLQGGSLQEVSR